ncbi:MAG TPA: branched-chain amino acid ABC transporter permease [Polyangia bacterium]|nr:branched-chain amino acid ABC transporter permease [Polyangia bacterium]
MPAVSDLANAAVSGVLTGTVYGLMALGLSAIFGVIRLVNFAHGELMTVAMYTAVVAFQRLALDPFVTMLAAAVAFAALGYALQRGFIGRFIGRPEHAQMLLMIALAMIIGNALLLGFGPDARNVQTDYQLDSFAWGPLLLDKVRVYAAGAAILATALLAAFFRLTLTGKAIRACADNPLGARVAGLPVAHLYAVTFGLGAASVAVAGCAMVPLIDVTPGLGPGFTLLAFVIVILGGLGSMVGALLGGVVIGLSEALAGVLIAPSAKSMVSFGLLVVILLARPQGLLGAGRR